MISFSATRPDAAAAKPSWTSVMTTLPFWSFMSRPSFWPGAREIWTSRTASPPAAGGEGGGEAGADGGPARSDVSIVRVMTSIWMAAMRAYTASCFLPATDSPATCVMISFLATRPVASAAKPSYTLVTTILPFLLSRSRPSFWPGVRGIWITRTAVVGVVFPP